MNLFFPALIRAALVVAVLGSLGIAAEKVDWNGNTDLMWAAQDGNISRVKKLVEDGANVNAVNRGGYSVLSKTVHSKRVDVARYLILNGAKPANDKERGWVDKMLNEAGLGSIEGILRSESPASGAGSSPSSASLAQPVSASDLKPQFSAAENGEDYAVIIGIEKYDDLPMASYAERDARTAKTFVRAMGVPERNIKLLTGGRATKTGIEKTVEAWLPNNVSDKSKVYFYYSGHGAPDAKTKQAYLVPSDGDPQYLTQTGYSLERLYSQLGKLKAKQVLVALDSCFSGAGGRSVLAKGTRPLVGKVDVAPQTSAKIAILAASDGDQISGSSEEAGYGLFTYSLLQGLNGAAKDAGGQVTLKSLYDYLKPKVQDQARRENREQTPQLRATSPESFVLRPAK